MRNASHFALALFLPLAVACAPDAPETPPATDAGEQDRRAPTAGEPDPAAEVDAVADAYLAGSLRRSPESAYFAGLEPESHDGLTDNTPEALAAWHDQQDAWIKRLRSVDPASLVGTSAWITHGTLLEALEADRAARVCRVELWNVNQMGGWQLTYTRVASLQPVGEPGLREQALARWSQFPGFIRNEIANLERGLEQRYSSPRAVVRRVIDQVNGLVDLPVEESPFYSPAERDGDEAFRESFRSLVAERINPALSEYRGFLEQTYLPAAREALSVTANPDGEACYRASLRSYTTLDRPPAEVFELGRKTVEANRQRVVELGRELYGLEDFGAIIEHTDTAEANRFGDREAVLAFTREAVERARSVMDEWFAQVPAQPVVVEPYPEYQEKTGVSSRYDAAPDADRPGTYKISLWPVEDQRRGDMEVTAVHETWPGHHLQIALAREVEGLHPVSRLLFNSGFVEGWARYSESLAEEAGIYRTDFARISRRAWPARGMVVDPGLHVKGWTREQAVAFLVESGEFSEQRANEMVDRIAILPGQLTAYDSGALEIFALREQARAELGERFDIKGFHGAILHNGSVPLPMMRAQVERWIAEQAGEEV